MSDIQELIHRRRRQVLHHSILYYKFNVNHVADSVFDSWAQELARLQVEYPADSAAVPYQLEAFKDFTGETGFHLPMYESRASKVAHRMFVDSKT